MSARIAINGFGRIGRASFKIALEKGLDIVAINDLTDINTLAHLLKYDSAYGIYEKDVSVDGNFFVVDGKKYELTAEPEPKKLPWEKFKVDVVLECTGRFVKDKAALAHIEAGAKKVIISAPAKGEGGVQTFVKGVNDQNYLGQNVISNASCTTNCTSPVVSTIHSKLKVIKAGLTTIHAATATQNLVDGAHKDLRRARSALTNIIPTTTGAAIATTKTIPDLKNKFDGVAVRVPVLIGSLVDVTMLVEKKTSVDEVNSIYVEASKNPIYKGVLDVSDLPLVSSDIVKNPHSAIVDLSMTKVIDGDLVKVLAWYDNEWAYSTRLVEMATIS